MANRILFVGEEQPLWEEFRSYFSGPEQPWLAEFTQSAPEALARVEEADFAAVIADAQVSAANAVALLDEIMKLRPQTLRVIISDPTDTPSTVHCVGRGHHHLFKPCDSAMLLSVLNQAMMRQTWQPAQSVQKLISQMRWVPSPPGVYLQLVSEMQSPMASVDTIGSFIAQDPAVTAKVLQLANSAVFGLQLQVVHPAEAVAFLGLETTKALVLLAHTFSSFEPQRLAGFSVETLWQHSIGVGAFARRIAQSQSGGSEVAEQAFSAGLLHDLGKLLFAANMPRVFGQAVALARAHSMPLWQAEIQLLGACHAEVGASLLAIWGLPSPIVEAVALHHSPQRLLRPGFCPLTAVHTADVLKRRAGTDESAPMPELALDYLQNLGLAAELETWQEACNELATLNN